MQILIYPNGKNYIENWLGDRYTTNQKYYYHWLWSKNGNVKKCQFYIVKIDIFWPLPLISQQPMMIKRQTIPHMNALLIGTKILGEQLSSFFRGCHATSSLESVFFTRKVAWSSLIELHSCSWHILTPTSRAKKWGIICLCSSSDSHSNCL